MNLFSFFYNKEEDLLLYTTEQAFYCATILFIIGILGITFNIKSLLISMMSIEIIYLAIMIGFIFGSKYIGDPLGSFMPLFILSLIAAETAVGCGILIASYKVFKTIKVSQFSKLRF